MTGNLFEWPGPDSTADADVTTAPVPTNSTILPATFPPSAANPTAKPSEGAEFLKSLLLFVVAGALWLAGRMIPILVVDENALWILFGAALGTTLAYAVVRAAGHTRSTAAGTVVAAGFVASVVFTGYMFYVAIMEELGGDLSAIGAYGWLALLTVGGAVVVWSCLMPTAITWLFTRLLKFLDPVGPRTAL